MRASKKAYKRIYLLREMNIPESERTAFLQVNLSLELREELENNAVKVAEDKMPVGSFNRWVLENCYAGWENLLDEDTNEPIKFEGPQDFGILDNDIPTELVRAILGRRRSVEALEAELSAAKGVQAKPTDAEEAEKN